jgi:F-type H+-transporting ATPase subunit b
MFLKPDGTFFFQLINFAIFFAILNAVFLRPVGEAIRKRRTYIESVQADFGKASDDAKAARAEADQKRAAARRQADETIAAARSAGEAEAATIVADRTVEAQTIAELARAAVEGEVAIARARSGELASSLAKTLVERAVGDGS